MKCPYTLLLDYSAGVKRSAFIQGDDSSGPSPALYYDFHTTDESHDSISFRLPGFLLLASFRSQALLDTRCLCSQSGGYPRLVPQSVV